MRSLLNDPNTESPANQAAADLLLNNPAEYYRKVREVVEKSWEFVDYTAE